ncbi:Doc1p [Malassezia vespertilionis]|uniref:Doc1p n=1 Tax=Malassezia vespertilionis TaxID=2020962 RepID=A0A2N1JBM4_9BASI|nr:Doc1p [Malassezia vespertilionis]
MVRRQSSYTDLSNKHDVGSMEGTTWLLSSAKPDYGAAQLTDDSLDTLWQYVPVYGLLTAGAMENYRTWYRELFEPQGWCHFFLDTPDPFGVESSVGVEDMQPIDVFVLQICILGNHLNGKDTHIRSMKVFGPSSLDAVPPPPAASSTMQLSMERLVEQGMRTDAFQRQVLRVGYERATLQLRRIMQQHAHSAPSTRAHAPPRRSLLSHTLR